jgi:uncharacterized protein (DUF2147 family)
MFADPAISDPIAGMWKTDGAPGGTPGLVEVAACGAGFCAVIKGAADGLRHASKAHLLGRRVFWDMVPAGDGTYAGGQVWSPAHDKEYDGRLTLTGDRLLIEGCVLLTCREGGRWVKVD